MPDPKAIGWVFANPDGVALTLDTSEKEWSGSVRIPGNAVAWNFECTPGPDGSFTTDVRFWSRSANEEEVVGNLTGRVLMNPVRFEGSWRKLKGQKSVEWILPAVARRQSVKFTRGFMIGKYGHKIDFTGKFPVLLGDTHLTREINRHIQNGIEEAGAMIGSDISDSLWDSLRYPGASWAWDQVLDVELVSNWPEVVSFRTQNYVYTGGAHGNSHSVAETWAVSDGRVRKVTLPDMFPAGSPLRQRLGEIDRAGLLAQGASSVSADSNIGFDARHLSEFTVSREGIELYHPPYEAGSYAEGEYVVRVLWTDLGIEIRPEHPMARALGLNGAPKSRK